MANKFVSGLKKFGKVALEIITFGATAAKDAAPFISLFNPALALLLSGSATIVLAAETAGAAAVATAPDASTGAQKAALAAVGIEPLAVEFCQKLGFDHPTPEQIAQFTNYIVGAVNVFGKVQEDVQAATATQAVTTTVVATATVTK